MSPSIFVTSKRGFLRFPELHSHTALTGPFVTISKSKVNVRVFCFIVMCLVYVRFVLRMIHFKLPKSRNSARVAENLPNFDVCLSCPSPNIVVIKSGWMRSIWREGMGVQNVRKRWEIRTHWSVETWGKTSCRKSMGAEGKVSKRFVSTVMNVRPCCSPQINPRAYSLFTFEGLIFTWIMFKYPVCTAQYTLRLGY